MASTSLRDLKIKTGVVSRTLKELASYRAELDENKAKVEQVRASADHSMLKQWENVLGETQGMIPDTQGRLAGAVEQLHDVMEKAAGDERLQGSAELEQAEKTLRAASEMLGQ